MKVLVIPCAAHLMSSYYQVSWTLVCKVSYLAPIMSGVSRALTTPWMWWRGRLCRMTSEGCHCQAATWLVTCACRFPWVSTTPAWITQTWQQLRNALLTRVWLFSGLGAAFETCLGNQRYRIVNLLKSLDGRSAFHVL